MSSTIVDDELIAEGASPPIEERCLQSLRSGDNASEECLAASAVRLTAESVGQNLVMKAPKSNRSLADLALPLVQAGLAVLPVGDDKCPLVRRFDQWSAPPSETAIQKWSTQFPIANVAVLCDLSGLVVVDIDMKGQSQLPEELLAEMICRFGETAIQIRTPSGGFHLYYRSVGGERGRNLRPNGLPVDIKAGPGAYVVAPPSITEKGHYAFLKGSWGDLSRLPDFERRVGSIKALPDWEGFQRSCSGSNSGNDRSWPSE